jgi:predicted NBD/HSP70 family sugar kinase
MKKGVGSDLLTARGKAIVGDLRRVNRSVVLRPLFFEGPLNRVDLGQLTGLSSGSITNLTAALLEEGLIVEVGFEQSDGGRPRVMLQVNPEFGAVIGVEIGETGVRVEGFDLRLRVAGVAEVGLHPQHHDADVTVEETVKAVERIQAQFSAEGRRLLGVGVAVPGIVEHRVDDARVHAPIIGWHDVPLERLVRERVGAPVFVENGAKALGQVEMWFGAGRGTHHTVITLWGTGVGAAIFTNGTLYRGAASSAGEWGHNCIIAGGRRCRCGSTGCLEAYIGAEPLLAAWREADPQASPSSDPDEEGWADRFLQEAANCYGVAAANLANLFNPELIVIGGWLGLKLGPTLLDRIREVVREQALDYTANCVRIELGRLGKDAVALGASALVVDELLSNGGIPLVAGRARLQRAKLL